MVHVGKIKERYIEEMEANINNYWGCNLKMALQFSSRFCKSSNPRTHRESCFLSISPMWPLPSTNHIHSYIYWWIQSNTATASILFKEKWHSFNHILTERNSVTVNKNNFRFSVFESYTCHRKSVYTNPSSNPCGFCIDRYFLPKSENRFKWKANTGLQWTLIL